jgi:DnaJ like chaperone protein
MNDASDITFWAVIVGAFFVGYWVVSALMNKIKGPPPATDDPPLRQDVPLRGTGEPRWGAASIYHEEPLEQQHARVLGLQGRFTPEEIKQAYRDQLLQYHPDRVEHLGPELKAVAHRKTQEIVAAYEYFRRKYRF